MITIYSPDATKFDTLGLAVLYPTECTVRQVAGGEYSLRLVYPITADGTWKWLTDNAIIKAPIPEEAIPDIVAEGGEVIENIGTWECISDRAPRYSKIGESPTTYEHKGDIIYANEDPNYGRYLYGKVSKTASTKWYWLKENFNYLGIVPPEEQEEFTAVTVREQMFRIYNIERDTSARTVTVDALQLTYDYKKCVLSEALTIDGQTMLSTITSIRAYAQTSGMPKSPLTIGYDNDFDTSQTITAELSYQNVIYALLDPDAGVVSQTKARIVRDKWNFFLLTNTAPDRGFVIDYGKNLLGVRWTRATDNLVTRLFPRGKNKDGTVLYYDDGNGKAYVDSALVGEYPFPCSECYETSVQVGQNDSSGEPYTVATARKEMARLANKKFLTELCDWIAEDIEINFIKLGDSEEYKQYRDLETVRLYDTVTVKHGALGLMATAQVKEYEFDCIRKRYNKIVLGNIWTYGQKTVVGYEIGDGVIRLKKLAPEIKNLLESVQS